MLVTIGLITLGVVGYLNSGYWWGRASWKIWQKKQHSFAGLLCFPVSCAYNLIGCEDRCWLDGLGRTPVSSFSTVEGYSLEMSFTWPLKALWNSIVLTIFAGIKISSLVCGLPTAMAKIPTFLPKRQPKQLPPAEPGSNQFSVDEHQRLLEQREEMDIHIKELEANPDHKKIRAFPKRL